MAPSDITAKDGKLKRQPSVSKIMASVFWDEEGILLVFFLERFVQVNSELYKETLNCSNTSVDFVLTEI
jgi:hypothetical protein